METSLIFKTFVILGFQLSLVFGICLLVIKMSRRAASEKSQFMGITFSELTNSRGELDLQPDDTSAGLQILTWVWIASMFAMVYTQSLSFTWGLITMTISSLSLGPVLGMIMLNMDENDGLRALRLTILITFGAGAIGLYSGLDFSGLGIYLFYALIGLILLRLVMLFTKFASGQRRLIAIGGGNPIHLIFAIRL
jgi:FtsH-binding integral membrane protein